MIEAAGGVVWREASRHQLEVLVVHRPHRKDWSLPKGKRHHRESALDCAIREVHEETGMRCTVGAELPETRYSDRRGRPKRVRYWSMHDPVGEFRPNDEVDDIRWLDLDRVGGLLTYPHDLVVVSGLERVHAAVG
jgi:8-oxo-dGTP pyrophosphatase MutT (NUDIX family)